MFHMQERQLLLSSLFKKPVHNAVRRFSCFYLLKENSVRAPNFVSQDSRFEYPWRWNSAHDYCTALDMTPLG